MNSSMIFRSLLQAFLFALCGLPRFGQEMVLRLDGVTPSNSYASVRGPTFLHLVFFRNGFFHKTPAPYSKA
jgi:hypothetical protein